MSLLLLFGSARGTEGISRVINSFGEQSQEGIPCALGFETIQPIKLDLSFGVQQLQSLLQRLCQGDPFVSLQPLVNKLVYDKHKIQGIVNVINSSLEGTQSLLQQLCEGDPFVSLQSLKSKLVDDKHKVQKIFSTVASSVEGVQSLLQQICEGDPFVWFQSLKNKLTDDKRKVQKILNTLTSSIEGVQSLFQSISLGDPFVSLQSLTNKLTNDKRGIQGAINTITASIEGVQSLLQQLCKGDPFISAQLLENKLADDKRGLQKILNTVTSSVEGLQFLLQQICEGDPFISLQSLKNKLTDDKRRAQGILNVIAGSIEGIQPLLQSMSLGDVASLQKVLSEMADKDFVISQQKLLQTLQGLTSISFPIVEYDVFLDGVSIKDKIDGVVISCREDSVHNSIEIQSADCDLFWDCDPIEMEGTSRIKISVGTRQIYFLLEKRAGDEQSFSIWGRSLSAREDSPYVEDLEYSLVEPKSAKSVVEEILTVSSLNWQCGDWTLPSSFEFEGVPIDGIMQIVTAIGAVVRCEDDGTICVRQKFPVRPVDMNGAAAEVNYDRKDLTKLSYDHIKGTHYNAIEVIGCTDDVDLPDMLVEESAPEMGDDVHIRVYWAGEKPSGIIETYVTDGKITSLGEEVEEEEEAEIVAFEDGVASVSKPITSVINVEWIGDSGGEVTCDKYSKDLEIEDGAYRVARITYKTTYSRYRLDSHDVEMLLALLTFGGESDVSVLVKMGEGDRPASDFYGSLLTSESIAVVVGTAWLDANRYDYKKVKLETPYDDNALDGVLAYVNDAKIDCIGNFHIESSDIIISGPKVINELEVIQCQV